MKKVKDNGKMKGKEYDKELRARAELYRTLGGGWQPQP